MIPKYPYPSSPKVDVRELIKVSRDYRKNVFSVLLSIFVFILGYLAVVTLSLLLIYYGAKLALGILVLKANWITLLAAAGVMIVVIMFFVFVIKFMFKIKKEEEENKIELNKEQHPLLFDFIKRVCEETKAPKPHKIVVSPSLNAAVYYNSSFLSMFFPVRKNLEIGLALVSCLNMTEFKAVMAHEFGHFSQSSTRLGSYVYRFNRMIHNLLYDNDGWTNALSSVTSIHSFLSFFGGITVAMANLVLRFFMQLYKLINISYLSLSREMEFHADSVAVSVSGSRPIISALYRLEFANRAFAYTLQGIVDFNKEDIAYPENFFPIFERNILVLAKLENLPLENNRPIITTTNVAIAELEPRIHYKDVWATHPITSDREKNANRIVLESEMINNSPWELFSNPTELQKKMSKHLVELGVKNNTTVNNDKLVSHFEKLEAENNLNPVYKGFYSYAVSTFAIPNPENKTTVLSLKLDDLFNDNVLLKLKRHQKNSYDTEVIKNISEGHLDVKRFEFDGKPYTRYYSAEIYHQLKKETEEEATEIKKYIQTISDWFYYKTEKTDSVLSEKYKSLMVLRTKLAKDREPFLQLLNNLISFYHKELTHNFSDDDVPDLRKKMLDYYADYLKIIDGINEESIPTNLNETIFSSGYKSEIFNPVFDNPSKEQNLNGFVPFVKDLEKLIEKNAIMDTKVYHMVMKTQEEMLEHGIN